MALFRATIKTSKTSNGVRLEKGMSVDFPSKFSTPLMTNGGHEVIDAFDRKYGIDIKKAGALNSTNIDIEKIN